MMFLYEKTTHEFFFLSSVANLLRGCSVFLELASQPITQTGEADMATKKKAKAVEPEEIEMDEVEVDAEEGVEEAPAPKAKKKAPVREPVAFGTKELAEHVNEATGKEYDAYSLRILLRKLAKDGVITRDESTGRARYSFTGPKDPQVKAIVKAVKDGGAEKAKAERLEGLKETRKAKAKPAKAKKAPKVEEPEVEEDDLDVEDI